MIGIEAGSFFQSLDKECNHMRYRDAVEEKRKKRELINQFNKDYYNRARSSKGLYSESKKKNTNTLQKGTLLYDKNGKIARVVKIDGSDLYCFYRGKTIVGSVEMVGKSLFLRKQKNK